MCLKPDRNIRISVHFLISNSKHASNVYWLDKKNYLYDENFEQELYKKHCGDCHPDKFQCMTCLIAKMLCQNSNTSDDKREVKIR